MPIGPVTILSFRETINSIINDYAYKLHKCIRRDFRNRTLIVIVEKYILNTKPKFIDFDTIKTEIENTNSIITGKINITVIEEIFYSLDKLNLQENMDVLEISNNQEAMPIDEIKSNKEENNIEIESIENSVLDFIDDENFFCSFIIKESDEHEEDSGFLEIENDFENISNVKDNIIDVDKIKKERDFLNIFAMEASEYKNK